MKLFVATFAVFSGLNVLLNLVILGTGKLPTYTTGGIAIDTAITCMVFVWAILLLSVKEQS